MWHPFKGKAPIFGSEFSTSILFGSVSLIVGAISLFRWFLFFHQPVRLFLGALFVVAAAYYLGAAFRERNTQLQSS